MKIVYKDCPEDIKKFVDGSIGSTESEYRRFLADQSEEELVKALDYLKKNGINITRQKAIEKELKYKKNATISPRTNHDFVMDSGRHFSEEWADVQEAARRARCRKEDTESMTETP